MSKELMIIQTVKEVSSAVNSILCTYKEHNLIRKSQKIFLQEKINQFRAIAHARAIGELFNANIEEIARAQRLIESMNFNDYSYRMAMEQLQILHEQLKKNLKEYSDGYKRFN